MNKLKKILLAGAIGLTSLAPTCVDEVMQQTGQINGVVYQREWNYQTNQFYVTGLVMDAIIESVKYPQYSTKSDDTGYIMMLPINEEIEVRARKSDFVINIPDNKECVYSYTTDIKTIFLTEKERIQQIDFTLDETKTERVKEITEFPSLDAELQRHNELKASLGVGE